MRNQVWAEGIDVIHNFTNIILLWLYFAVASHLRFGPIVEKHCTSAFMLTIHVLAASVMKLPNSHLGDWTLLLFMQLHTHVLANACACAVQTNLLLLLLHRVRRGRGVAAEHDLLRLVRPQILIGVLCKRVESVSSFYKIVKQRGLKWVFTCSDLRSCQV